MNAATLSLFVLWLVYGAFQWRNLTRWRVEPPTIPSERRPMIAMGWLFGSAAVLLAGLLGIFELGGFPRGGITIWAWVASLLLGVVFVHGQVTAAALLFSMGGVTNAPGNASELHGEVTSPHENSNLDGDGIGVEPGDPWEHPDHHP